MRPMSAQLTDAEFERAHERYYLRSARAAVEHAYWAAAWRPVGEVRAVLSRSLERRGVDPDPEAVQRAAELISRGRKPLILRQQTF
jgi:thiamine pyrophosphate-dependent acetolactate synthase large subunit-like protein